MYRSTERYLKLLSAPFNKSTKTRRGPSTTSFTAKRNFSSLKSTGTARNGRTGYSFIRTLRKENLTTKPPVTEPPGLVSILNPNKRDPDLIKEQMLAPIIPKTASRFPKSGTSLPSVTRVLQDTMPAASKFLLDRWKEGMIKKLGTAGFAKYQQDTFERGRVLHALVANYLMGQGDPKEITAEIVANLWKSIQNVIKENITNVRLVEHIVTHSDLKYRGIVDCVAQYKDELVVIDFKTAEKPKNSVSSLYDNPIQVTAYCGALNNDCTIPASVIDRNICAGLIIVAYIDGSEASVYYLGRDKVVDEYWKKWTNRLDQFSRMEELK